ncbi:hypothetical protein V8E54_000942, partial [Elaphomyces granulatus]
MLASCTPSMGNGVKVGFRWQNNSEKKNIFIPTLHLLAVGALSRKRTPRNFYQRYGETALIRRKIASEDNYDAIGILSPCWISDNTGALLDTKSTERRNFRRFRNTRSGYRVWSQSRQDDGTARLSCTTQDILSVVVRPGSSQLELTPKIDQKEETLDFSSVKNIITKVALKTPGLDVLFIMDCCCSAIGGRDGTLGGRVEFMAATALAGISNSREDGDTFTQDLCKSFEKFSTKKQFTCFDLMDEINAGPEREQYRRVFVLQGGWNLSITFRPKTSLLPKDPSVPAIILACTLIVALHVKAGPTSEEFKQLVEHLEKVPVPVNILALPTSSTLLLL